MKKLLFILCSLLAVYSYGQIGTCNNIGFENSTVSNWDISSGSITGVNLPCSPCATAPGGIYSVVTPTSSIGSLCSNGVDAYGSFPVVYPDGGNYSLLLNNNSGQGNMQQAVYSFGSYPAGYNTFTFSFAAVLQSGGLAGGSRPYFSVQVIDSTTGQIISCSNINNYNTSSLTYFKSPQDTSVYCYPWQTVFIDLTSFIGQTLHVFFTISDSPNGVNFGYVYIDASCILPIQHIPFSLCPGVPATLNSPAGFASYNWSGPVSDTTQNLTTNIPGNYTLTTTSFCPSPSYFYTVTATASPVVNYTLTQDTAPHTWDVYPVYSQNTIKHNWNWGDGSPLDTSAYPSHTYALAGTYSICVSVTDANGCMDTSCQSDAVYRLANNSVLSNMVYVNVLNSNQTTGVNQLAVNSGQLVVYPNPAQNSLQVTVAGNSKIQALNLYDLLGNEIPTPNSSGEGNSITIDVSNLQNGVYFIQVKTSEGVLSKKIVIQH